VQSSAAHYVFMVFRLKYTTGSAAIYRQQHLMMADRPKHVAEDNV
jgi:hypothetical protein